MLRAKVLRKVIQKLGGRLVLRPNFGELSRAAQIKFLGLLVIVVLLTITGKSLAAFTLPGSAGPPLIPSLAGFTLGTTGVLRASLKVWPPEEISWVEPPPDSSSLADLERARRELEDVALPSPSPGFPPGGTQAPGVPLKHHIKFERLSVEHGLSQSSVLCILQDSMGFMWFGTWDGLNKYDGYGFTVYKHDPDNPYSLSDNVIRALYEDHLGVLWVGTRGGLNRFDWETERFVRYQHDPSDPYSLSYNEVLSIQEDSLGVLWIGTLKGGLNKLDRETDRFVRYQHDPDVPYSLSDNDFVTVYADRSGVLWVGTRGGGLNRLVLQPLPSREDEAKGLSREAEQFIHYRHYPDDPYSLSNDDVLSIYEDHLGVLWVGTGGGGLNKFDRDTGRFIHYRYDPHDPNSLSEDIVQSIYEDRAGVLWIGTYNQGLDRFDRENEQFIHYQNDPGDLNSLSKNNIRSIYEDRSGVFWVGTNGGGLNKSDVGKRNFIHYRHDPGDLNSLSGNDVFGICEDRYGVLWVGTYGSGLNGFDRETGHFVHYKHNPYDPDSLGNNVVFAIHEDRYGVLWVGTHGGGLNKFDRRTGRFTRYKHSPTDLGSLSDDSVFTIYEDRSGELWIGTLGGGLNRFYRGVERFKRYQYDPGNPNSLSNDNVRAILEDREGMLWIATDNGLNRFDRNTRQFARYQHDPADPHSLSDNWVFSIHEDQSGVLWVATYGGGLNKFDRETETFTHYREKDGLPGDSLYGILEDDALPDGAGGNLWISTNNGLSRFDPRTETFKNYDVRDGLQSNEFNGNAYYKSRSGEMFFGGINGLTAFYPENIKDNPYVPPIVLTSLTQGGEKVDVRGSVGSVREVTLHWPNNFFEFEFATLSYVHPEKNQYAYMLEDFDNWNYIGTRRLGRYTNLPGGTYTLRLRGSNNDGVWNERGVSVTITVVPPFWETWWFRSIAALALVGSVIGGYQLRVRGIEARTHELEIQVEERTYEIERRRRVAEGLREIVVILNSDQPLEESLDYIVSQAVLLTDAQSAIVYRREEASITVIASASGGQTNKPLEEGLPAPTAKWLSQSIKRGRPLIVPDFEIYRAANPEIAPPTLDRYHALLGVPLSVGEELYGGVVFFYERERHFPEDVIVLGFTFADQAALAIANAQLRDRVEQTAAETERNRLARDLHDAVTQTLFSASLIAEALPNIWEIDRGEGRQLLAEMRRLSRGALAEMRNLLLELRPAALAEAKLGDLLRQLAEAVTGRKDISITVTIEGQCVLPPDVHVALYRIAQEALNNVVKHAHAEQVTISLHCTSRVELRICDDGCGFDPTRIPPDRLGLGIIRERAQSIGAGLTIESQPGSGTQIVVVWEKDRQRMTNDERRKTKDERRMTNDGGRKTYERIKSHSRYDC